MSSFFSLKGTKTHAVNSKTSLTGLKKSYHFNPLTIPPVWLYFIYFLVGYDKILLKIILESMLLTGRK